MPPKSQRQTPGRGRANEDSKEEPLQAIVIADTFETRFSPFTLERPRCLLPLVNNPLIEYTLETLAITGVQDVYLYAGAHVDQVETYINASKWNAKTSPFRSLTFIRCVATSVGDILRDADSKSLLTGDFLVVSGDVICEYPIGRAIKAHKARREKDKNAIMTMLLREADSEHYSQANSLVPTFVIDPSKDRCLHYEEGGPDRAISTHIDPEMLKTPELDIRQDLIDCRIDICTPDVLSSWSDNFDNQAPRRDFLFGMLKDYELNGKTIHTYIIEENYAARATDMWTYGQVSRDILQGKASIFAPERNLVSESRIRKQRGSSLINKSVIKARPVYIDDNSIVGEGTSIGARSRISKSIIGHRCHIGKNSMIEDAYIWDDATLGSNVTISKAIIGAESFVGDNSQIGEGCLISYGAKVPAGSKIAAGTKITKDTRFGHGGIVEERKTNGVARSSFAEDEEDDEIYNTSLVYQQTAFGDSTSTLASDVSEPTSPISGSRSQSFATSVSDDDGSERFQHDTVTILVQRMQEGTKVDDMLSELMGLRFSGGANELQVRRAVAVAMSKRISAQTEEGMSAADAAKGTLQTYRTLIRRENAPQSTDEQVEFLLTLQRDLIRRHEGGKVLLFVAKDLYELSVIEDESFTSWWSDDRSSADDDMKEVRKQTAQFIEWLENAESESEEDDEDDDEE